MKLRLSFLLFLFSLYLTTQAQSMHNAYLEYIQTYSKIAVEQQHLHRIPASITLAQGLLESGAGKSRLATEGNNHFGIKCHGWTGQTIYADDDAKNECFRKYPSARDSYEDHSLFLTSRPRYASLFTLPATDYRGWAHGLKAAGYATDPNYANKLIKLINDYELHKFDTGQKFNIQDVDTERNREVYVWGNSAILTLKGHTVYRNNGVKCVFSQPGDTYASIAREFKLKEEKLLQYNDLKESHELEPNTVIYLKTKKKQAEAQFPTHIIKDGESMYRISQKYAIRLQSLYDLNGMPYHLGAKAGETLHLHGVKRKR